MAHRSCYLIARFEKEMPFFESFLCFERNGQSSFSSSLRLLWSEFAFVRSKCKDCEAAMRVLCMRRGAQRDLQMASMQFHRPSSSSSSYPAATTVVGFSSCYYDYCYCTTGGAVQSTTQELRSTTSTGLGGGGETKEETAR